MLIDNDGTMQDAAQQAETELTDNSDNTDDGTRATGEGAVGTEAKTDEVTTTDSPAEIDPLTVLDSLQLDQKTKDALKAGFLRQADYTKKTQALGEDRKLIDEYQSVKPYIDKVLQNPELYKLVFEGGEADGQDGDKPAYPEDPLEYAEWVKAQTLEAIESKRAEDADFAAAESVDPRLNSDPEYAHVIAGFVARDADFLQGNKTAEQATKDAVAAHNAYVAKLEKGFVDKLNKRVTDKRMVVPQGNNTVSTEQGRPKTMQDAARMAEEELSSSN